jgi:dihydropteroate synthase
MAKDTLFRKKRFINFGGKLLDIAEPKVMGILNVTPDSFYDGGFYESKEAIKKRVNELLTEGAAFIDVGACSSRPGAKAVSEEEELSRLDRALGVIRKHFPDIIVSVDTYRASIAGRVVREYQVDMINDISAGMLDPEMFNTIADLQVPYIIMHMPGDPGTMQQKTDYKDLLQNVTEFLAKRKKELSLLGVNDVLIDPGFGFGKTLDQNFKLLNQLEAFQILEVPVVVGISRKSMIHKLLGIKPEEALNGTTALHMMALERGVDILRVHDVKEAVEVVRLYCKTVRT